MRYIGSGLSLILLLGGCAQSASNAVSAPTASSYEGIEGARSFWIRTAQLVTTPKNAPGFPYFYKACFADGIVASSPPDLTSAVNRFLADKTPENLNAVAAKSGVSFFNTPEMKRVKTKCQTEYFASFYDQFQDVDTRREFTLKWARLGAERDGINLSAFKPALVECTIDEYWRTVPGEFWPPVDRFLVSKSRADWDELIRVNMTFQDQDGIEDLAKAVKHCKATVG